MGINPLFLTDEQLLDLLLAELPDGVYAQDRANAPNPAHNSYSSSEMRATATILAGVYTSAQQVFSNYFITTLAEDGLGQWETDYFGGVQDASIGFLARQQNLFAKFRATGGLSMPYITSVVSGILDPVGLPFAILALSGQVNTNGDTGTWILGYSSLGQDTYLGDLDPLIGERIGYTPLDCSLDYAAAGITADQLLQIQNQAYAYEVRIYGNADATTLSLLEKTLTKLEPARSTHYIFNNSTPPTPPS